ncbi:MAG: cobalamin B12-binding domain-containing protein [Nitrospirae bacterium]|nr:cobalamin B12-binding domain-containing protein [Nitrospirota bacterium]
MLSRILIISTNREMSPQPVVPIGAAWVAESLHQAGFQVRLLDLAFEKDPQKKVDAVLGEFKPHGIGLSVRNVDNGDFLAPRTFLPQLRDIVSHIKSKTDARILVGGSGVSVMPYQMLEYLGLDYACVGEGEEAAVMFFSAKDEDEACRAPGLVCKKRISPDYERKDWLSNPDIVRPRMDRWVDVKRYLRFEPVLPVQGKRGCANRCLYCTYNRIEGRTYRLREPGAVVEEISAAMLNTKVRTFEFVDSIFNQPEGYMEVLLEEIIRWRLKAKFHVASISPKGLTASQVKLMQRAGITAVGITPEAASDTTLASLRKGFTASEVHRAAEVLGASGISALWCFLLGGPGEDAGTVGETINFINRKIGRKDKAFVTAGIRIYPQTGMHETAIAEGCIGRDTDLLMPTFYFTDRISPSETRDLLKRGLNSLGDVIFLSDTNFSTLGGLRRLGTAFRLPSPFWRYAGYMNMMITGNRIINKDWRQAPGKTEVSCPRTTDPA